MRLASVAMVSGLLVGAQPATASSEYSEKDLRQISSRYARCVVRSFPARARRFLVGADGKPPIVGDCLVDAAKLQGAEMRFAGGLYRYALAEALLVHDYPNGLPANVADAPKVDRPAPAPFDFATLPHDAKRAAAIRERFDLDERFRVTNLIADCVARQSPTFAYNLTRSLAGTAGETAAFNALKPAISVCLPPSQTIHFGRMMLRGALALNLYQMAYAIQPADSVAMQEKS